MVKSKRIEYILEGNFIVLFSMQNNLLGPGISFYRKSIINVKRKPNYEIDWFHN